MSAARHAGWCVVWAAVAAVAGEPEAPTFAGPTMGTTYRVRLAAAIAGRPPAAVHREVEDLLARIDRAASTWRDDSDASRFNRAAAGEWVAVADDLAALVAIARDVHRRSDGAFDVTAAPLVPLWSGGPPPPGEVAKAVARVGMHLVELRPAADGRPAALRKALAGVAIDLSAIAPGYAVDAIGERLVVLGSRDHLVELGGEVRAWGAEPGGRPWRVRLRGATGGAARAIDVPAGTALATATIRPGRSPLDPRTGRPVAAAAQAVTVRAGSCAEADALATAAAVLGVAPARSHGIDVVSAEPSN